MAGMNDPPPIEVRQLRKMFRQATSGQSVVAIERLDLDLPERKIVLNDKGQVITEARLGEEVTVRVRVRSLDRGRIPQVALVDVLPGGLEPVQNPIDASEQTDEPLWRRRLGGSGNWMLDFVDVREDRVLFFGTVTPHAQTLTRLVQGALGGLEADSSASADERKECAHRLAEAGLSDRIDIRVG